MNCKFLLGICAVGFPMTSFGIFINGSFEDPLQSGPDGFSSNGIPGWSTTGNASGVWRLPSSSFFPVNAPDGLQIGYLNGSSMAQQASDTIQQGSNVLSFYAGKRDNGFAGSFKVDLFSAGTINAGVVTGGTLLGTYTFDHTQVAQHTFTPAQISYTALAGDASIGQLVSVMITRTSGAQANFDDFRFQGGTVPEPATLAALAIGIPFLAKRRKR